MAEVITKKGVVLPLHATGSTTFGTATDVAVTVAREFAIAERHFTILPEGGRYILKDLESGLGTQVNAAAAKSLSLVHGDRIQAGKLELVFSDPQQSKTVTEARVSMPTSKGAAKLDLAAAKESVENDALQKRSLLASAFGRKKKSKLVLPTLPKKKPLQKPLIKREVIRIPVKPDPNNPPRTIVNRLLGKKRVRSLPELKLESITEKPEVTEVAKERAKEQAKEQVKERAKEQVKEQAKKENNTVAKPVESKSIRKPEIALPAAAPLEKTPEEMMPAVPIMQSATPPVKASAIALPALESPSPATEAKSATATATGTETGTETATEAASAPVSASEHAPETEEKRRKKQRSLKMPPVAAIIRKQLTCITAVVVSGCKIIPSTLGLFGSAIVTVVRSTAPLLALPARVARFVLSVCKSSVSAVRSLVANVRASIVVCSRITRAFLHGVKIGISGLSRAKDSALSRSASIGEGIRKVSEGGRRAVQNQYSTLMQRRSEVTPVVAAVSEKVDVGIYFRSCRPSGEPKVRFLDGWWQAIGVGSAIAVLTVGIVWDHQNKQVLYGFLSQYTESKAPTLMVNDEVQSEPAVAISRPRSEYPVTENDQIVGTWVAIETVDHGAGDRRNRRVHSGAAFRFERWGGLKMLTGAGRQDGQRLSDIEALGLQVHFQASYEILQSGLVVFHTEDGDLLFSARRKKDGLALALLAPDSHEPVVELFCLPNSKLKR